MLQNEAMIVRLSISKWTARKFDKSVTRKIASEYGTAEDTGRFNKVLIAKEALQAIERASNAARSFHYENTLPWDDAGGRLLPTANFMEYSKKMRGLKSSYETAVKEFLTNYPEYRKEAEKRLNKMFNPLDYPSTAVVSRKFGFTTDIEPVPHADDFRVTLQKKDKDHLAEELQKSVDRRMTLAIEDLFKRLLDVTQRFADTLSDPDAIFRNSMVENAIELVCLLPKLNIGNNSDLENMRKQVAKKLAGRDPELLRSDKKIRHNVANDAQEILRKLNGYISK